MSHPRHLRMFIAENSYQERLAPRQVLLEQVSRLRLHELLHSSLAFVEVTQFDAQMLEGYVVWLSYEKLKKSKVKAKWVQGENSTWNLIWEAFPQDIRPLALLVGQFALPCYRDTVRPNSISSTSQREVVETGDFQVAAGGVIDNAPDNEQVAGWTVTCLVAGKLQVEFTSDLEFANKLTAIVRISHQQSGQSDCVGDFAVVLKRAKGKLSQKWNCWQGTVQYVHPLSREGIYQDVQVEVHLPQEQLAKLGIVTSGPGAGEIATDSISRFLADCQYRSLIMVGDGQNASCTQADHRAMAEGNQQMLLRYASVQEATQKDAVPFEQEAFIARLFLDYQPRIYKTLLKQMIEPHLAEDASQDAFLPVLHDPAFYWEIEQTQGESALRSKLHSNAKFAVKSLRSSKRSVYMQTNLDEGDEVPRLQNAADLSEDTARRADSYALAIENLREFDRQLDEMLPDVERRVHRATKQIAESLAAKNAGKKWPERQRGEPKRRTDLLKKQLLIDGATWRKIASVKKLCELLRHELGDAVTVSKVRYARLRVIQARTALMACHRLFCTKQPGQASLLSQTEFAAYLYSVVLCQSRSQVLEKLGIDKQQLESALARARTVVPTSIAILDLHYAHPDKLSLQTIDYLEELLIGGYELEEIASRFHTTAQAVRSELSHWAPRVHAQLLRNQTKLPVQCDTVLQRWIASEAAVHELISGYAASSHLHFVTNQLRACWYKPTSIPPEFLQLSLRGNCYGSLNSGRVSGLLHTRVQIMRHNLHGKHHVPGWLLRRQSQLNRSHSGQRSGPLVRGRLIRGRLRPGQRNSLLR